MKYVSLLRRSSLEPLEARIAPATFLVTTTADSGPGSLRQAIVESNELPGADVISFEFGPGLMLFRPTSPLPAITDTLKISGDLNPHYDSVPRFILSGVDAGAGNGLSFSGSAAAFSRVEGLTISGFQGNGIEISDTRGITIVGCYMGKWSSFAGNAGAGIRISESNDITVGLTGMKSNLTTPGSQTWGASNVIVGNGGAGIHILGGEGHEIYGNLIGLTAAGAATPNAKGIFVQSSGVTIGGAGPADGNVISGNTQQGIHITSSVGNIIQGNHIGTDIAGTNSVPNGTGLLIEGSRDSIIGGTKHGEENLVSGNIASGIVISAGGGVGVTSAGATKIQGNLIGTDITGTKALPNKAHGISITRMSSILVGGDIPGAENVVSANGSSTSSRGHGILLSGAESIALQRNFIGTDITGTLDLGNVRDGIAVLGGKQIQIGGHSSFARNIISGNGGYGISFGREVDSGYGTTVGGSIKNTYVGLSSQDAALGNDQGGIYLGRLSESIFIDGGEGGWRNVISANKGPGITVEGSKHFIRENIIGLNPAGTVAVWNSGSGIEFKTNASTNIVRSNFIAINGTGKSGGAGIVIVGNNHVIEFNQIGFNLAGTIALGNGGTGIIAGGTSQILHNRIAGYAEGEDVNQSVRFGILIAHGQHVVSDNVIERVHTGISVSGGLEHQLLSNSIYDSRRGIAFEQSGNGIVSGNTIRGMSEFGIKITGNDNTITENAVEFAQGIGMSIAGTNAIITGNIISHTGDAGMYVSSLNGNLVEGNRISDFQHAGIMIDHFFLSIPSGIIRDNQISDGNGVGIQIKIGKFELSRNLIYDNTGIAIDLGRDGTTLNDAGDVDTGPNSLQNTATFRSAVLREGQVIVQGTFDGAALRTLRVEFFAISLDSEGTETDARFLGETSIYTDANGHARLANSMPMSNSAAKIVATVTDVTDRVTSEAATTNLIIAPEVVAVGTGAGARGTAKLVRASDLSETIATWKPYGEKFRGGVRVAHADIDGDGLDELITAPASNGRVVRVFSGFDGTMLTEWDAAPRGYRGGISIAAGDVDGDGTPEIVTALGFGRNSTVTVRDAMTGEVETSFLAFGKAYRSGLNLSVGDLDSDGDDDIVASLQSGVGLVRAFTGTGESLSPLIRPFAGQASIGAFTAVIPATPESAAKIAVGSGVGARGAVEFFDVSGSRLMQLPAFDGNRFSGLRLASADVDADGIAEIIVARGPGHMPRAEVIGGGALPSTVLFAPALRTGLFLG